MVAMTSVCTYGITISPDWIIAGLGSAAALIALVVVIWERAKPIVDVYFEDGGREITCKSNELTNLKFLFENKGRRTFVFGIKRKAAAESLSIMIYFPLSFGIKEAERQGQKTSRVFTSSLKGRLANKQYVFVPDPLDRRPPVMTSLRFGEVEACQIIVKTPTQAGEYEILFDMGSEQGDLGLCSVKVRII